MPVVWLIEDVYRYKAKWGKDNLHGWKKPILPLCDQTSACTCKVHVASDKLLSLRQHICFKSTHHQNKCQKFTFLQTTYMLNFRFLYVWLDSKCYLVHNHSRKYRGLDLSTQTQLRCFDFSSIISNLYCYKQGWKFVPRSLKLPAVPQLLEHWSIVIKYPAASHLQILKRSLKLWWAARKRSR